MENANERKYIACRSTTICLPEDDRIVKRLDRPSRKEKWLCARTNWEKLRRPPIDNTFTLNRLPRRGGGESCTIGGSAFRRWCVNICNYVSKFSKNGQMSKDLSNQSECTFYELFPRECWPIQTDVCTWRRRSKGLDGATVAFCHWAGEINESIPVVCANGRIWKRLSDQWLAMRGRFVQPIRWREITTNFKRSVPQRSTLYYLLLTERVQLSLQCKVQISDLSATRICSGYSSLKTHLFSIKQGAFWSHLELE